MKKTVLLAAVLLAGMPVFAQYRSQVPAALQDLARPLPNPRDETVIPLATPNATVHSDAVLEDLIGSTRYDRQTNRSIQNRMYYYPDGTIGASWMRGMQDAAYNDRGTGYNYFNGASWGPVPTQRLESFRTGWPSYTPWGANGEMIIAHRNATSPLVMMKRPEKGTGAWTSSDIPGPAASSGLDWPRVITSGPDRMTVHMIVVTGTTALGGSVYQGLDGALVYYRSLDGGENWDRNGIILPELTSNDYYGFGGDDYAWGTPRGDTVYFVVGGNWEDTFIMASYDNGENWTKIPILANSMTLVPPNTVTERFACSDGSLAVEMDRFGVFHVVFGRMFAKGEADGQKYYPYTDGLIYWNSTMPMLHDSLDPDTLFNNGQLIGYVYPNEAGDTVVASPNYGVGLTSYPQITIDENDNMYVMWCGLTVGNVSADDYNFRHLYLRASKTFGQTWGDSIDLHSSFIYSFLEFVYPSMAKTTSDDALHFIYQSADQPGSSVADENIPVHDNTIEYRSVLKEDVLPLGTNPKPAAEEGSVSQNYPNPFTGITFVNIKVMVPSEIQLSVSNMMGQVVRETDLGTYQAGTHQLTIDGRGLPQGVYAYTVRINGAAYPGKMILR